MFLDYNQNAKDRTVAGAYSVRPTPDARVSAPLDLGRDRRVRSGATSRWRRCRRGSPTVGDRHADIDRHACSLEPLLELSARQEREGLGDAPWPPHYRKQAGEPARVQPSRRRVPKHPLIEIGRAQEKDDALAGLERWKARHPEAAAHLSRPTCSSMPCAAGSATWTRIRVNLQHVPEELRPAQEPLDPDEDVGTDGSGAALSGGARPLSVRTRAEDLRELVRRRDLELIVAAVVRLPVGPPAQEHRRVPEAIALQVVVLHLAHALDPQRLPRQILAGAPAALPAGHALPSPLRRRRPLAPRMSSSASLAQRRQLLRQRACASPS